MRFATPDNIARFVGETLSSDWFEIDQARINAFGEITDDPAPYHTDPAFAQRMSPWGSTIAFGFLSLSLLTPMLYQVFRYPLDGDPAGGFPVNYGFRKLRFVRPVPVNSRLRAHFTVKEVSERKPGQQLTLFEVVQEIENTERPALTAEWESLWIRQVREGG